MGHVLFYFLSLYVSPACSASTCVLFISPCAFSQYVRLSTFDRCRPTHCSPHLLSRCFAFGFILEVNLLFNTHILTTQLNQSCDIYYSKGFVHMKLDKAMVNYRRSMFSTHRYSHSLKIDNFWKKNALVSQQ